MREVTVSTVISAPREQIFDFVFDLAGRPAYTDHFMRDYRLARVNPVGVGAAARFQLRAPLAKEYAELQITEVDRPRRIVEEIRVGRRGRNRSLAVYDFTSEEQRRHARGADHLQRARHDRRPVQGAGAAGWMRRQTKKALERLRMIFEEPPQGASSSGPRSPASSRQGAPLRRALGMDPSRAARAQ